MTQDILATNSPSEWGELIGKITAFSAVIFGIVKWVVYRSEKRIIESRESLETQFMSMLKDALVAKAERAGHGRTRVIDITFVSPYGPDNEIRLPVILDEWLTVLPGTDIMADEFAEDRTGYFLRVDANARIREHKHKHTESVHVIKGMMRDLTSKRCYYPGEMWTIPAGQVHAVQFESPSNDTSHGIFLITVRPPLPSTSEVSLSLDGMSGLA